MNDTIAAAQQLGRRGFRVHPLKAKDQPYTKYSQTATSNPDEIAALFAPFPDALIGICTGQGLVVVDDDRGLFEGLDPSMPTTLAATTPSGRGLHYYFTCPTPLRNSASKIAEGIDVRAEGGYVVAPPSEGRAWINSGLNPTALPGVLLSACLRSAPTAGDFEPRGHVPAGERHDYLVRAAGWMLANEIADEQTLYPQLLHHAQEVCDPWPPGDMRSVEKHIRSMCRWVLARESGVR